MGHWRRFAAFASCPVFTHLRPEKTTRRLVGKGPITEVVPVRIDLPDSAFHEIRAAISFGDAAYGDH
jgi:hypothetical protein